MALPVLALEGEHPAWEQPQTHSSSKYMALGKALGGFPALYQAPTCLPA